MLSLQAGMDLARFRQIIFCRKTGMKYRISRREFLSRNYTGLDVTFQQLSQRFIARDSH